MLRENITAIVTRNETWEGDAATEPYEAGWATEAVIYVRALARPTGPQPRAVVEISPDGMHWVAEGSTMTLPSGPTSWHSCVSAISVAGFVSERFRERRKQQDPCDDPPEVATLQRSAARLTRKRTVAATVTRDDR